MYVMFNYINFQMCSEFELILKNIKWPYLGSAAETFHPSNEQCIKLALLAEYLFLVR